jgi:hypothetical protein
MPQTQARRRRGQSEPDQPGKRTLARTLIGQTLTDIGQRVVPADRRGQRSGQERRQQQYGGQQEQQHRGQQEQQRRRQHGHHRASDTWILSPSDCPVFAISTDDRAKVKGDFTTLFDVMRTTMQFDAIAAAIASCSLIANNQPPYDDPDLAVWLERASGRFQNLTLQVNPDERSLAEANALLRRAQANPSDPRSLLTAQQKVLQEQYLRVVKGRQQDISRYQLFQALVANANAFAATPSQNRQGYSWFMAGDLAIHQRNEQPRDMFQTGYQCLVRALDCIGKGYKSQELTELAGLINASADQIVNSTGIPTASFAGQQFAGVGVGPGMQFHPQSQPFGGSDTPGT